MKFPRRSVIALIVLVLLALTACGQPETSTPASVPAPAQNAGASTAPVGASAQGSPGGDALRPANVPEQLTFLPGRAGGGAVSDCFDYERYQNMPDQSDFYTTKAELNIGDSLTICYYNFPVSEVTEQIFDERGSVVRELRFTIDTVEQDKILDATDFTAMPRMDPGLYRVVTQFPDHQEELSFRLTGRLVNPDNIALRALSSGSTAAATGALEFLILDTFPPNAQVTLAFYTPCFVSDERLAEVPEDERYTLSFSEQYVFVTAAQVSVDASGRALIQVPDELRSKLAPERDYLIRTAPADATGQDVNSGEPTAFSSGETSLRGTGEASAIACPYVKAP